MSFLFLTSISASLPLVPLHHLVADLRLALGESSCFKEDGPQAFAERASFLLTATKMGGHGHRTPRGRGTDIERSLQFSLSSPTLSGTAIQARVLTSANNPRLPSKRQVTRGYSLTRTENPATEASPPPLPLSLAVPQLISRHDTGSVFVLKISASEEKGLGSAVALRRKFLLSQQVTGIHHN